DYSMSVANGAAVKTDKGANIIAGKQGALRLLMAQK
ncbi:MAG: hypothetical protein JWQ02_4050, partial [Capsulimonas sp.]|nr:hypothetical protein [Capsulimonas sp.]